mmetsp:Transcript_126445/g.188671  ORF Transcript_126445/g.188671 Transcript_126445/m.188671 type:complete len:348 (+) Transcript_126445:163-1206(+)
MVQKNWKVIAGLMPNRTDVQCLHRWQKVLNPDLVKGPWSSEEDEMVVELVGVYGPKSWSVIAKHLKGRIGKQCRERWHNHLDPNINREPWTEEEDDLLIEKHQQLGNKWAEISKFFTGRTDNMIKNRWNSTIKRRVLGTTSKRGNKRRQKRPSTKNKKSPNLSDDSFDTKEVESKEESPDIDVTFSGDDSDLFGDYSFDVSWMDDASIPECIEYVNPNSLSFSTGMFAELSIPDLPKHKEIVDHSDVFTSLISPSNMGPINPPFTQSLLKKRALFDFFDSPHQSPTEVKRPCNDTARGFAPSTFFGSSILRSKFMNSPSTDDQSPEIEETSIHELFDSTGTTEIAQF